MMKKKINKIWRWLFGIEEGKCVPKMENPPIRPTKMAV